MPGLTTRDSDAGVRGLLLGQPRAWPVIPFCTTMSEGGISETGLDATGVSSASQDTRKGAPWDSTSRPDGGTSSTGGL